MLKVKNKHGLVTVITVDRSSRSIVICSFVRSDHNLHQIETKNISFLSLIYLNVSRAQHDTLSKKGIVIFDDNDAWS